MLAQLLVNAVALGSAYALVALGFVLVLNATGAVNFAQGELVVAGGLVAAAAAAQLGWPMPLLLPAVVGVLALLGIAVGAIAYWPLRDRPADAVFVSTIAAAAILETGALHLFGPEPVAVPPLAGGGLVQLGAVVVGRQALATIVVAVILIVAVQVLLQATQLGRRLRATAQDRAMAAAIGIPVGAMVGLSFALAAGLAGAAGMLLGGSFFVSPGDGGAWMVKAYIATAIGGWGSVPGTVAGAALVALFEVLYPALPLLWPGLGPDWLFSQTGAAILLYLALLAVLMLRPRGLFGEPQRVRA